MTFVSATISSPTQSSMAQRGRLLCAIILVGAAVMLGGGGSPAPLPEMALEIVAAALFATWVCCSPPRIVSLTPLGWTILAALLGLPLLQLIPLPPIVWHAFPGRQIEQAALNLIGQQGSWRPISVSPARTLASLLAAIVPAIMFVMVSMLGRNGRTAAVGAVAGASLLGLMVGAAQMAGGEGGYFRFYVPDANYLSGFQANHNSTADVLLIGMVAFVAVVRDWAERRNTVRMAPLLGIVAVFTILFSIGVVLTASRTGIALLPIGWIAVAAICKPWLKFSRKSASLTVVAAAAFFALAGAFLFSSGAVWRVAGRFHFENEFRPELWRDAWFVARQYFPIGAGVGTLVPVFIAIERLEVVDATAPNRAHNEFLEMLVESGAFGIVIWTVIGLFLVRRAAKLLRAPGELTVAQIYFAVAAVAVIALHSQVDYPLRSMSLATLAALAIGLLMPLPRESAGPRR